MLEFFSILKIEADLINFLILLQRISCIYQGIEIMAYIYTAKFFYL